MVGWDHTKKCWGDVGRTLGAVTIAAAILALMTWWISDPARTQALTQWHGVLGTVLVVEVIGALGYTIWPRKATPPPLQAGHAGDTVSASTG